MLDGALSRIRVIHRVVKMIVGAQQAVAADEWQLHWLKEPCIQALAAALDVFGLAAPVLHTLSSTAGRVWAHLRLPLVSAWAAAVAAPSPCARKRNRSDSTGRVRAATKLSLQDELLHIHASAPASAPGGKTSARNAPKKHARRQAAASRSSTNETGTTPATCKDHVAGASPVVECLPSELEQTKRPGRVAGDAGSISSACEVSTGAGQSDLTGQFSPGRMKAAPRSALENCSGDGPSGAADDDRLVDGLLDTLFNAVDVVGRRSGSFGRGSSGTSASSAPANDVPTVSYVASQACRYI